jgi:carbon-monoxide dehydrogenase medium subunit
MRDFEYEAPATLAAAAAPFSKYGERARPMAGGTDLLDQVRTDQLRPDVIVDLKKIPELNILELSDSGLELGAAVTCSDIYKDARIATSFAALTDSCQLIGGIQIQNRASVGGNLCNSGPAGDSIPSLIALSAVCVVTGPGGTRNIPVEDFCTGPGKNVLRPEEILVQLRIPPSPSRSGSHYRRFTPRNEMDIAVCGVGASVALDESKQSFVSARIALGAVAPTPLFVKEAGELLIGRPVADESIREAAQAARAAAQPIDDMRGTKEFRIHLAGVLTERVLRTAVDRARDAGEPSGGA